MGRRSCVTILLTPYRANFIRLRGLRRLEDLERSDPVEARERRISRRRDSGSMKMTKARFIDAITIARAKRVDVVVRELTCSEIPFNYRIISGRKYEDLADWNHIR